MVRKNENSKTSEFYKRHLPPYSIWMGGATEYHHLSSHRNLKYPPIPHSWLQQLWRVPFIRKFNCSGQRYRNNPDQLVYQRCYRPITCAFYPISSTPLAPSMFIPTCVGLTCIFATTPYTTSLLTFKSTSAPSFSHPVLTSKAQLMFFVFSFNTVMSMLLSLFLLVSQL